MKAIAFTSLPPAGQKYFDDFLAAHPQLDANDVLSALRPFPMMEHFATILEKDTGLPKATAAASSAKSSVRLDDGSTIPYADYRRMTVP